MSAYTSKLPIAVLETAETPAGKTVQITVGDTTVPLDYREFHVKPWQVMTAALAELGYEICLDHKVDADRWEYQVHPITPAHGEVRGLACNARKPTARATTIGDFL